MVSSGVMRSGAAWMTFLRSGEIGRGLERSGGARTGKAWINFSRNGVQGSGWDGTGEIGSGGYWNGKIWYG